MAPSPVDNSVPAAAVAGPHHRKRIMEPLVILAFLVGWLVIQIWVLPKLGVQT